MHKTIEEALVFVKQFVPLCHSTHQVCLALPYTAIHAVASQHYPFIIGAQNVSSEPQGAFTGEISAQQLAEAGAVFTIIGHSERRKYYGETNKIVNAKIKATLPYITPVVCIGENLEDKARWQEVVAQQLHESLHDLTAPQIQKIIVAYEPVWAIGSGMVADENYVQQVHNFCRAWITQRWHTVTPTIIYGGSVNCDNAQVLLQQKAVDGLLVGGASLDPLGFSYITNIKVDK